MIYRPYTCFKLTSFYIDIAVRLVDGPSAREGRLEVYYDGKSGTVCDDGFTDAAAGVVCYMLGYGYVFDTQNVLFRRGFTLMDRNR